MEGIALGMVRTPQGSAAAAPLCEHGPDEDPEGNEHGRNEAQLPQSSSRSFDDDSASFSSPRGGLSVIDPHSCQSFDAGMPYLSMEATMGSWRWTREAMHGFTEGMFQQAAARERGLPTAEEAGEDEAGSQTLAGAVKSQWWHLRRWVMPRVGEGQFQLFSVFFVVNALAAMESTWAKTSKKVNALCFMVVCNALSLVIALLASFLLLGPAALRKVTSWRTAWRFMVVAWLFMIARTLILLAQGNGATLSTIESVGYAFMPLAAALSMPLLNRRYGSLEWLSLGIMTLSVVTFVQLHAKKGDENFPAWSCSLILASAAVSALASVWTERIYKARSRGTCEAIGVDLPFCVYKAYLDFASLLTGLILWPILTLSPASNLGIKAIDNGLLLDSWFGEWSWKELLSTLLWIAISWMAGLVTKRFSTVFRAIAESMATIAFVFAVNPWLNNDPLPHIYPSVLLIVVLVLAAAIFQTGRLNIRHLMERMHMLSPLAPTNASRSLCDSARAMLNVMDWMTCSWWKDQLATYGSVFIFVLSDAGRTLTQQQALSKSMITPQSMVLAVYLSGAAVALLLTVVTPMRNTSRWHCVGLALSPKKILQALPSAIFFSGASTLLCLAYAYGVSAVVATALGYVYMPISAVASRCCLGKFYIWLEWFALMILTLAAATFGLMSHEFSNPDSADQQKSSSIIAMPLVVGSAMSSVFASLVAERLLKEESHLPFHIQKTRLDIGSALVTVLSLPLIGWISTRPQDAFWKCRPLDTQCGLDPDVCWHQSKSFHCDPTCRCDQDWGIFVAWGDWRVILALVVNILQGWLTGVVIKKFSTVMRAIAQASTILVIYFIGDPIANPSSVHNAPLTLVAFIVPLSTTVFMVAVSEMEKVMHVARYGSHASLPDQMLPPQDTAVSGCSSLLDQRARSTCSSQMGLIGGGGSSKPVGSEHDASSHCSSDGVQQRGQPGSAANEIKR